MRITVLLLAVALAGCGQATDEASSAPDAGSMVAMPGGTGGTGGRTPPSTGGTGGMAATGGSGGQPAPAPDAGAPKPDTMPAMEPPPAGPPTACMSSRMIVTSVCLDRSVNPARAKIKDGRACNICATYKSDGRTVDHQFIGCIPAAGSICVMDCSECK
jgi:hypothetical protein